jgi:branched-chain amino acid transport system substrate-binding protein
MTFVRGILALLFTGGSIAAGFAAACSSSSSGPPPVNQQATDTIPIGAVISLTGTLNYLGLPEQLAVKVALSQVNAVGGVLGKNLALTVIDDATDPNTSQNAYNSLNNQQRPVAFIGPTGSPAAVVVQAIAFQNQIIDITPSASTPILTDAQPSHDRYMFRTAASHDLQAKALAKWMAAGPPGGGPATCTKPAVIYQDDAFGAPMAAAFQKYFPANVSTDGGITPGVVLIKVPATAQGSYKPQVDQVINDPSINCQLLILFQALGKQYVVDWINETSGQPTHAFDKFLTLGCNALQVDTFIAATRQNPADPKSPSFAENMYTLNFDTNPQTPEFGDFKNLFTAQNPLQQGQADISPYTANTYDAVILIALAIQQAGGTDDKVKLRDALFDVSRDGTSFGPAQVADALAAIRDGKNIDYQGASGNVDFDDNGDVLQDFVVFKIQQGAFSKIQNLKASSL